MLRRNLQFSAKLFLKLFEKQQHHISFFVRPKKESLIILFWSFFLLYNSRLLFCDYSREKKSQKTFKKFVNLGSCTIMFFCCCLKLSIRKIETWYKYYTNYKNTEKRDYKLPDKV